MWSISQGVTIMMTGLLWYLDFLNNDTVTFEAISNDVNGNQGLILIDDDVCYNFIPGEITPLSYVKDHCITLDSHKITLDKLFH